MAIGPLSFNESGLFECLVFIPCTGFAYAFSKTENSMSAPKRLLAIINPISGTKDKEEIPALIREVIDPSKYRVECVFTQYAGHGAELTRRAVDERVDIVLSVGGDGTCNEIARELIDTSTALAIVPVGSGNGLARHLGISMDVRNYQRRADRGFGLLYGKRSPFFLHLRGRLRCIGELEIRARKTPRKIVVCG